MTRSIEFEDFCVHQHDVVCNQKYNDTLPYSFHLYTVRAQVHKFRHLLSIEDWMLSRAGAMGHDLIEDARVTYNDIKDEWGTDLADIIYCCTELRGRNRAERHGDEYFNTLSQNRLATFVKLADISANITFSLLTNSTMYAKYKKEFPKVKEKLFRDEFQEFFDYIEHLLSF